MLHRHGIKRLRWPLLVAALSAITTGCATDPIRSVVEVVPANVSYSFDVSVQLGGAQLPVAFVNPSLAEEDVQAELHGDDLGRGPVVRWASTASEGVSSDVEGALGEGQKQLDPELGPMDLGYPLLIDLGAGEAPYDDGVPTIHGVELTRGGFSDTVLQASWRESYTRTTMLHATVAWSRFQDLGILDGLEDMRFAWVVIGWKASF